MMGQNMDAGGNSAGAQTKKNSSSFMTDEKIYKSIVEVDMKYDFKQYIRDRNRDRAKVKKITSRLLIEDIGQLVTTYCYGADVVIPEVITEILDGKFYVTIDDICQISARLFCDIRHRRIIIISAKFNYDCISMFDSIEFESFVEFILTGYDQKIYKLRLANVPRDQYNLDSYYIDTFRRKLIEASVRI